MYRTGTMNWQRKSFPGHCHQEDRWSRTVVQEWASCSANVFSRRSARTLVFQVTTNEGATFHPRGLQQFARVFVSAEFHQFSSRQSHPLSTISRFYFFLYCVSKQKKDLSSLHLYYIFCFIKFWHESKMCQNEKSKFRVCICIIILLFQFRV